MKTLNKSKKSSPTVSPTVTKSKAKANSSANMRKKSATQKAQPMGEDIIQLILQDHKPLKKLIKILKNLDKDRDERQRAFEEFGPLLVSHAKPEEQTLYVFLKHEAESRENGLEGDVEHNLADQLLEEAKRTADDDLWSARVKVLAEIVEHHMEDEEDELLPLFKKNSDIEDRRELGSDFLKLKTRLLEKGDRDIPAETPLEIHAKH